MAPPESVRFGVPSPVRSGRATARSGERCLVRQEKRTGLSPHLRRAPSAADPKKSSGKSRPDRTSAELVRRGPCQEIWIQHAASAELGLPGPRPELSWTRSTPQVRRLLARARLGSSGLPSRFRVVRARAQARPCRPRNPAPRHGRPGGGTVGTNGIPVDEFRRGRWPTGCNLEPNPMSQHYVSLVSAGCRVGTFRRLLARPAVAAPRPRLAISRSRTLRLAGS
jgi:hypothetical protein